MPYQPTLTSLRSHPLPKWFDDAKLGIFIHWGLFSVPAWAPTGVSIKELFQKMASGKTTLFESPYAEWYLNNLKQPGSQTQARHARIYGSEFPYEAFAPMFNAAIQTWEADSWADLFQEAGARYVVLTSKHHDGFTLWQPRVVNPKRPGYHAERDLVGELTSAVKKRGMRMGLYYSGGLDWTFNPAPVLELADLFATIPQDDAYVAYCLNHWNELIERYEPAILWNDIGMPYRVKTRELFARYYNRYPEGVVNDRFSLGLGPLTGLLKVKWIKRWFSNLIIRQLSKEVMMSANFGGHYDFITPEYSSLKAIFPRKWEATRGLGNSFGYNQAETEEDYLSVTDLIRLFVDIVSKNGNLLLNVGPQADGSLPAAQAARLRSLGRWLAVNGEGIFESRPWARAEGVCQSGREQLSLRFTQKDGRLYCFIFGKPGDSTLFLPGVRAQEGSRIRLLGSEGRLAWQQEDAGLRATLEAKVLQEALNESANCLEISPAPII